MNRSLDDGQRLDASIMKGRRLESIATTLPHEDSSRTFARYLEAHASLPNTREALTTVRDALRYAIEHVKLRRVYWQALDAYYEFDKPQKSPRRTRLTNCTLALLDFPEHTDVVLARYRTD